MHLHIQALSACLIKPLYAILRTICARMQRRSHLLVEGGQEALQQRRRLIARYGAATLRRAAAHLGLRNHTVQHVAHKVREAAKGRANRWGQGGEGG